MSNKPGSGRNSFPIFRKKIETEKDLAGSRGFTFIETLVALFIIMMGISSLMTLINQTLSNSKSSSFSLTAAYLGKEGIEIVKNIRDSNFLAIHYTGAGNWNDGLTGCEFGCQADYTSTVLAPYDGSYLRVPGAEPKFYSYSAGSNSLFRRRITIEGVGTGPDYLKVKVEVMWSEKGRSHNVITQENLYPWW